jgi:DNA-binding LacI/PurR family transcriptional regulator
VDVDGTAGTQLATEYLIKKGHCRIALLAWPESSRAGDDRMQGYLQAMQAAALPIEPEWVARVEGSFEAGKAATQRWLARAADQRPTGQIGNLRITTAPPRP